MTLLTLALASSLFTPQSPALLNTGINVPTESPSTGGNSLGVAYQGDLVAALVREVELGGDANGDGDDADLVLQIFDAEQETLQTIPIAATASTLTGTELYYGVVSDGRCVAFGADEAGEGAMDLNGDGDALDSVLHVVDTLTGAVVNTGLDIFLGVPGVLLGDRVLGVVSEERVGSDLNQDQDTTDFVYHVYTLDSGELQNLGLAAPALAIYDEPAYFNGSIAFLLVGEIEQGSTDLNGSGAVGQNVLFLYRTADGTTENLGLSFSFVPRFTGGVATIAVSELEQATDLNGDGDRFDFVTQIIEPDGNVVSTGRGGAPLGGLTSPDGRFVAYAVIESSEGADLNGDGDDQDWIIQVFDLSTRETISVGVAGFFPRFVGSGERTSVVFSVPESELFPTSDQRHQIAFGPLSNPAQGTTDLNGDGDTDDLVLASYDLGTDRRRLIPIATSDLCLFFGDATDQDQIFVRRDEAAEGIDLNGDADQTDVIATVYDLRSRTFADSALAIPGCGPLAFGAFSFVRGTQAAFPVRELGQNASDLNGDGDTIDAVLHVLETRTGIATNLGLAIDKADVRVSGNRLLFRAIESGTDLNGDGDGEDQLLLLLELEAGRAGRAR